MKKDMKFLMPVIILFLLFSVLLGVRNFAHSFAAEDEITSGTSGTVKWTIYADGSLVLKPTSGSEGTLDSFATEGPWYDTTNKYHEEIKSVSVEGTVHAGESVVGMFSHCKNLETVNLTGFDTSNTTNFGYMFYDCPKITSLDLSMLNTANGTDFRNLFDKSTNIKTLDISNFSTRNQNIVEAGMRYIFRGHHIKTIKIGSGFDFHAKDNAYGISLGHGTWVREEDGKRIAAVDLVLDSSEKSMAGTYTKVSNVASDMPVSYPVDYKIKIVPGNVSGIDTTNNSIVKVGNDIFLKDLTNPGTDDYSVPGTFSFTVVDGAEDKLGNQYDLKVSFSNMHIYDLDTADYVDGKLSFMLAYISKNNIAFESRAYDVAAGADDRTEISKTSSAKYDVKYEILDKNGNPVEGSYVFSAYDLDVGATRDKDSVYPDIGTIGREGFGDYSEGINLISGYDADTIKMHPETYLKTKEISNGLRIFGTHVDEASELSEFSVKVDATEFKFQWTGEYCGTSTLSYYQPTNIEIVKHAEGGTPLAGASLELYYADGSLIESWTSTTEAKKFFLMTGTYVLKETSAPYGYKISRDLTFFVDTDGTIRYEDGTETTSIVMTNIEIEKSPYKVLYVDKETGKEIATRYIGDPQYIGENITIGSDKIKTIENYKYDSIANSEFVIQEDEEENVAIVYYVKQKGKVIVTYIDEATGEEISDSEQSTGNAGDNYTTIKKHIPDYVFSSDSGNTSGVYKEGTINVIYKYKKIPAIIDNINDIPDTVDTVLLYVMLSSMSLLSIILATYIVSVLFRKRES